MKVSPSFANLQVFYARAERRASTAQWSEALSIQLLRRHRRRPGYTATIAAAAKIVASRPIGHGEDGTMDPLLQSLSPKEGPKHPREGFT